MAFDAYAQWLKIPEDRRPPTHYDLLGLPLFEASIERIQAQAMDRMGHVRRYQLGQHSDAAIQLLKEISLAYDTLITPARKAAYDRRLSGMETVERVAGMATLVTEAPLASASPVAAPPPPASAGSGYVLAAVVEEPPARIPTSPFKPGFEPVGVVTPPPRKRRSAVLRRTVNVLNTPLTIRGAAKASWRMTAFSAKAGFWTVRVADRGMCRSLGDENTILHNFFRAVIGAAVLGVLCTAPWWMPGVWAKWKPADRPEQAGIEPATGQAGIVLEGEITQRPPIEASVVAPDPPIPSEGVPTVIGSTAGTPLSSSGGMTNSLGMSFVRVPEGEFDMGSAIGRTRTEQQHRVRLTRAFYLSIHEVTQAQFLSVMGSNPSQFTQQLRGQALVGVDTSRLPADSVLWTEAVDFCQRLTSHVQEQAGGRRYRLPTEAEWEYACRAGTKTDFYVGDQLQSLHANFRAPGLSDLTQRTMVVGSFAPNSLGLFDMHGNVEEWCSDYYDWSYYSTSPRDDPPGPASGFNRVVRGGSFREVADDCRSAHRSSRSTGPGSRLIITGFRVVCEVSK